MFRAELTLCAGVAGSPGSRDLAYQGLVVVVIVFVLIRGFLHTIGRSCLPSCFVAMSSLYAKPLLADVTQHRDFEKAELPIDRKNRATILQEFETLAIDDSNVTALSRAGNFDLPYSLLCEYIRMSEALCPLKLQVNVKTASGGVHSCTIHCGQFHVEATGVSGDEAKQIASQKILRKLHPFAGNWATVLRLYSWDKDISERTFHKDETLLPSMGEDGERRREKLKVALRESKGSRHSDGAFQGYIKAQAALVTHLENGLLSHSLS
ncbi:uncharacterized protein [Oscarella lobularis]|uniref:uncharacterized protein n=1 Tax=Oscarella lobularis TaxID=121494 RepID=UPI003313C209